MCSEGLSDFCSIAPHKWGHFVEYVHISLHISASLSICDSRIEWVNLQGVLLWHFCDRFTPNTRAVLELPQQLKSLLAADTNHSEREVATKQGATDEPVLPKSVDVCTECRFQLIESWKQSIHRHIDVLLINLLWRVGRVKGFSETFTEQEQELAEQLATSWIETACAPCILTLASFVFIGH
jgi:hypothetical protein